MTRKLYPLLFFAAVTVLAFWKVIFHSEFSLLAVGGDLVTAYYPWFDVAAYWLKKGVFLLWDPYVYSGKPFMGEPQPGMYYPLNWIFMLLPARGGGINLDGLQALLILNYLLAGYFFYRLARSFSLTPLGAAVAGVTFALGGFTIQIYGYVNNLSGTVWMPLVFLCFRRALLAETKKSCYRWTLWSGIFLGLSFLPGHHIPPVHTGLFLLFYVGFTLVRDWKLRPGLAPKIAPVLTLGSVALVSLLITAIQWLPSAHWARQVYRWIGEGEPVRWGQAVPYAALQSAGNISPQDAASLLVPYVSTNTSIYVGFAVLFLALVGLLFPRNREAHFFGFAAFLYLFLSWGKFSALHGWVNTFVPGAWFAREVFNYLIPFQICLAMLAGWGLDSLVCAYGKSPDQKLRIFIRRAAWGMGLLALCAGILLATLHFQKDLPMDHPYITRIGALATYVFIMGFLLFLVHTGRLQAVLFGRMVLVLIVIDLASQISVGVPRKTQPAGVESSYIREVWKRTPVVDFLRSEQKRGYFRIDDPSNIFPPNYGDAWRLDATMGHGATALVDYFAFRGIGWGPGSNATALLNVRLFPSRVPVPGMKKVFESGDQSVYFNPRAVPRVFAVSRYRAFSNDTEILDWLRSPMFSAQETVVLREKDLRTLSPEFLKEVRKEDEDILVFPMSWMTTAEKIAQRLTDEMERHKASVFRPPWGWGVGDEVAFRVSPKQPLEHCYLIISYFATATRPSQLAFRVREGGGGWDVPVELPGLAGSDDELTTAKQAAIDLGRLENREYQVSLVKTESCSANIDSLRLSKDSLLPQEDRQNTVRITSFKPNRLKLVAELSRPSFVVVSEVFFPGWEARIDGRRAPLLSGDYILRTIPVPKGKHEIELRYRPQTILWGLIVSLLSLAALATFLIATREKASPRISRKDS
jgi:hypothetical protein